MRLGEIYYFKGMELIQSEEAAPFWVVTYSCGWDEYCLYFALCDDVKVYEIPNQITKDSVKEFENQ